MEIFNNIKEFIKDRNKNSRYASFDYCFNYFRTFYEKTITKEGKIEELASKEHIQDSCLHLGFYLASWGMYRGSTPLLKDCSVKIYEGLIKEIAKPETLDLWKIDVNDYPKNIKRLYDFGITIQNVLGSEISSLRPKKYTPSDTLVTKIMLGIFGNCPALDGNFKEGMKQAEFSLPYSFHVDSFKKIYDFYIKYKRDFDKVEPPSTLDFLTGKDTDRLYTKAKLVDMAVWIEGQHKLDAEKAEKKKQNQ